MRVRAEAELLEAVIALSVAAAEVAVLFIFFKGLLQMFDANQRYASLTPRTTPAKPPLGVRQYPAAEIQKKQRKTFRRLSRKDFSTLFRRRNHSGCGLRGYALM
jgi:hypothetical protein